MKRSARAVIIYIFALIMGIMLTMVSFEDSVNIFKKNISKLSTKTMNDVSLDELLTGKVEYVIQPVAELETTRTINGIPVKKERTPYYLVYVNEDKKMPDGDYGFFVIIHATDKDTIEKMDSLMLHTQNYLDAVSSGGSITSSTVKPQSLEFKALAIPDEVMEYTYECEWFEGISQKEIDSMTCDMMLEEKNFDTLKYEPFMGIGVILLATLIFIATKPRYKTKRTHYVNEYPSDKELIDKFNAPPTPYNGSTNPNAARRYNPASYEQDSASAEMDSIDTSDIYR